MWAIICTLNGKIPFFKTMPTPFFKDFPTHDSTTKMAWRRKHKVNIWAKEKKITRSLVDFSKQTIFSQKHNFSVCHHLRCISITHLFIHRCGVTNGPCMRTRPSLSMPSLSLRTLHGHKYIVFIAYVDIYHLIHTYISCILVNQFFIYQWYYSIIIVLLQQT
jgi:hypothetical protein